MRQVRQAVLIKASCESWAIAPYAKPTPWKASTTASSRTNRGSRGIQRRIRRKVAGKTKTAVKDKLKALHADVDMGITPKAGYSAYTVRQAAEDWLREGLEGRSAKTIKKNENEFLSLSWRLSVPRSSANYRRPTCGRPCPRWPPGTRAPL